jgi:hypothetical protein
MLSNLTVLGETSLSNHVTMWSNLDIYGMANFSNNVFMSSNLVVFGTTTLSNIVTMYSNLTQYGYTTFLSNVSLCNKVYVNSNLYYTSGAYVEYDGDIAHSNNSNIIYTGNGGIDFDQDVIIRDLTVTNTLTFCNVELQGNYLSFGQNNSNYIAWSNVPDSNLNEIEGTLIIDSNLYVGGRIFCNGFTMTLIETLKATLQDLTVYGSMTLCNTYIDGILTLGTNSNQPIVWSNVTDSNRSEVEGTLIVDDNLYVGGRIFCNGIEWSAIQSMNLYDSVMYGTATFCNTEIQGVLTIGNSNNYNLAFSNITDVRQNEVEGTLIIDDNLYVKGMIYCNGVQWSAVNSYFMHDAIIYGLATFCNTHVEGILSIGDSNNAYYAFSNITNSNLSSIEGALLVQEDLYVSGRIFCTGIEWSAVNSYYMHDAVVYGTMTLCNADVNGVLTIGNQSNGYLAFSNIPDSNQSEINGTLIVDQNLYIGGQIFCNGIAWSSRDSYHVQDMILYGTATFCNTFLDGILTIGSSNPNYIAWSNVPNSNISQVNGALIVDEDLYIGGVIKCNGFTFTSCNVLDYNINLLNITDTLASHKYANFTSNVTFCNASVGFDKNTKAYFYSNVHFKKDIKFDNGTGPLTDWTIGLSNTNLATSDLVFHSKNNTNVIFTDSFASGVLNFTGQHRTSTCDSNINSNINIDDYLGKIVIATGKYKGLTGDSELKIDEAIPIIELCKKNNDKRVFGVIAGIENPKDKRSFKLGNLQFEQDKKIDDFKVIVNSVGEGCILVSNFNGNLENGDLISSCDIPGLGIKQNDDIIRNITCAKITCDCDFNLNSKTYKCSEFIWNGKKYKKALVGCTYHF